MSSRFLALALVALAAAASAQTPSAPVAAPPASPAATPAEPAAPDPRGFTYHAEGRRDPFVTLLQRGAELPPPSTTRVPGLSGLGASEVTLKGTLATRGGYVAIMQGVDTKTYIVRPGERLADGTVRSITPDAVVILQMVKDSLSLDKQHEVRKTLRQTEEAK